MICPKCHQPAAPATGDGRCPFCGFEAGPVHQRVLSLHAVGFAFFMSVLVYIGLVYYLDTQGTIPRREGDTGFLPYLLLLLAVLLFGVAWKIGQRVPGATSSGAVFQLHVIKLALFEAIALLGLVIYFLSGSLTLFGGFVTLSIVGFVLSGTQLPAVVRRMEELEVAAADCEPPKAES